MCVWWGGGGGGGGGGVLCQGHYLPCDQQDKVVEFARMNKQELLVETERAVGD